MTPKDIGEPIKINVQILGLKGETINCEIIIRNGIAVSRFSDPHFAKKLYKKELAEGNENAKYDEINNVYVELYPNKLAFMIKDEIAKELRSQGVKTK